MIPSSDRSVFEEHADEASFLWSQREIAAIDPLYGLSDVCDLDERLSAHVDGLRLAGDEGFEVAIEAMEMMDPGAAFTAMVLAAERGAEDVAKVIERAGASSSMLRGAASALGWVPLEVASPLLPSLLHHELSPELIRLGISACAAHRVDPGEPLALAVFSNAPRLKARALRAAGEIGRRDLLAPAREAMESDDTMVRSAGAWAAALLGDTGAASVLWRLAEGVGKEAERAADMAARITDPKVAQGMIHDLARAARSARTVIIALAALGDPALVPLLVEIMRDPREARIAGFALTMITGVDISSGELSGRAPEGYFAGPNEDPDDDDVAPDPDAGLPWPNVDAVVRWWGPASTALRPGSRYLLGKPLSPEHLASALHTGPQPARAAAAMELCLQSNVTATKRWTLFNVKAPGVRQRRALRGS